MNAKKGAGKGRNLGRGRVDTPLKDLDEKDTIVHYNAVMIEEQNSKIQLVLERMDVMAEQIKEVFRASLEQVNGRLSTLELAVRGLKDHMMDMDRKIDSMDSRISSMEHRIDSMDSRISSMEHRIDSMDNRISSMEHRICSKIDGITERCENHECRLASLEVN